METIRHVLNRLSHIYGRKFQYAWTRGEEKAQGIVNEWYRVLANYNFEILDTVIDKLSTSSEDPPSLSEFAQLCKTETARAQIRAMADAAQTVPGNPIGYCPLCGKTIAKSAIDCHCGWSVNVNALMPNQPPKNNWNSMRTYLNEYQRLLHEGAIHSGYEYFCMKIGVRRYVASCSA